MSDQLTERLSQLTPAVAGFDRDALLFRAGKASARPNRWWKILVAVLVVTQTTEVVVWRHHGTSPVTPKALPPLVDPVDPMPSSRSDPDGSLAFRRGLDILDEPAPAMNGDTLIADPPPLHVTAVLSSKAFD